MALDPRLTLIGGLASLACTVLVATRLVSAAAPEPRREATKTEMLELASAVNAAEGGWREETTQNFPSDDWSQRDDFHGREFRKLVELANGKGVRIEAVLRAVDDDIHRRGATGPKAADYRNARAVPCKPRPFYD